MSKTIISYTPFEKVFYTPGLNNDYEVRLHENIQTLISEDDPDNISYSADEVFFKTTLSKEEIEANFDKYWVQGNLAEKTTNQRIEDLENLVGAIIDELLAIQRSEV